MARLLKDTACGGRALGQEGRADGEDRATARAAHWGWRVQGALVSWEGAQGCCSPGEGGVGAPGVGAHGPPAVEAADVHEAHAPPAQHTPRPQSPTRDELAARRSSSLHPSAADASAPAEAEPAEGGVKGVVLHVWHHFLCGIAA
jgi:hypothetical protein